MSAVVEIGGVLREDGTLVLDHMPALPPGRVEVRMRSSGTDAVSVLEQIHAAQARRGHVPPTAEEIAAHLEELRDDERAVMLEKTQEDWHRQRGKGG